MTKLSSWPVSENTQKEIENEFWLVVARLKSAPDAKLFFSDLLTHTERKMLAKRLHIAKMLLEKESYNVIKKKLNVTSTTIAKISNWLNSFGEGYRIAYNHLKSFKSQHSISRP